MDVRNDFRLGCTKSMGLLGKLRRCVLKRSKIVLIVGNLHQKRHQLSDFSMIFYLKVL